MGKTFRCSGPMASRGAVASGDAQTIYFAPQTCIVVEGAQLHAGWEVVSLRRVGFAEIEVGGTVHGARCRPFTFKPRPDVDLPYRIVPRDDGTVVLLDDVSVRVSERLELTVRNTGDEPRALRAWWVGTTER